MSSVLQYVCLPSFLLLKLNTQRNDNHLTGTFPSEISKLGNVTILHLQKNKLNGTLPLFIGEMDALEDIRLDENQFIGTLPLSLAHLPNLERLNVANNQFHGLIPDSWGKIKYFNVSMNNDLSGNIPQELCSNSTILDFDCNANLCGCDKCLC